MKLLLLMLSLLAPTGLHATITNITYRVSSSSITINWRSDVPENKASIRFAASSSCFNLSTTAVTSSACAQVHSVTISGLAAGTVYCLQPFGTVCYGTSDQDNTAVPLQLTTNVFDTPTPTWTVSPTFTRTFTVSPTPTATRTITETATETVTKTPTRTPSFTMSPTATPTDTKTITETATETVTKTITETFTVSPTPSTTMTHTVSPTVTQTATPTATPSITLTFTRTATPSATPSNTPVFSATVTPTFTRTPNSTAIVYPSYDGQLVTITLVDGTVVNGYADVNIDYIRISNRVIPFTAIAVIALK